jgi:hypothetical protein
MWSAVPATLLLCYLTDRAVWLVGLRWALRNTEPDQRPAILRSYAPPVRALARLRRRP